MPTSLPPTNEPESRNRHSLEADAWAGIAVVVGMFVVGLIYWSGHTNDARATDAPIVRTIGSGPASQTAIKGAETTVR